MGGRDGLTAIAALERDERVHGADFGDVVLRAMQPEVLYVALGGSSLLCGDARSVVRSELVRADTCVRSMAELSSAARWTSVLLTSGGRAGVLSRAVQRNGFEALGVVRSDRTADDEEEGLFRWGNAKSGLGSDFEVSGLHSNMG